MSGGILAESTWANWPSMYHRGPSAEQLATEEEARSLRAQLAECDADDALIDRALLEVPWLGWMTFGVSRRWPPTWLTEMVDSGRADAIQADRALVGAEVECLGGRLAAVPMLRGRRWFRHTEMPRGFDPVAHASALRVLARCEGRRR